MVELNANADYLRKIIVQGRSSKSTKVGEIMTAEVDSCSQSSPIIPFSVSHTTLILSYYISQNKLVTVTSDTNIVEAMQLMTGKNSFESDSDQ